ncbi:hypothetical protein S83_000837 [Arachis hypogaea]
MLMEKRKNLYWTPCAAPCIDLMLEDFEKKLALHKDTIAKGRRLTTYIYSRTSLIFLLQQYTKGRDLVRSVDSEKNPAIKYMYSEIDRVKEKIKNNIIDERWNKQLFKHLHAVGYYLNPQIQYSPNFKVEYDVKKRLYDCLDILVVDPALIIIIDSQLEDFKSKAKFFSTDVVKNALKTKTPSQWWDSYGDEHPELQKFTIRVLSLTCSSSGCECNWSAFEMINF